MLVYVGTYTNTGESEGIYVYRVDPSSGALEPVQTVTGVEDPAYLALSPNRRTLYSVGESRPDGALYAFERDTGTGRLRLLNRVDSGGAHPAHVAVDPTGRFAAAANYTGGTVALFQIEPDGRLAEASQVIRHSGSG